MGQQMSNDGKEFEELVASLSNCLHEKAIITPNDKLIDKDTGKKRQIDISIRMTDGPTSFLGIVEARDRSRKVGVPYLEEVKSKRDSVGAHKAFIVSNKGFTTTALDKARAYDIELFSLSQALRHDWSHTFSRFKGFTVSSFGSELTICFVDEQSRVVTPHQSVLDALVSDGAYAAVICNADGSPKMKANELFEAMYREPAIVSMVDGDWQKKHPLQVRFDIRDEDELFLLDTNEEIIRVKKYFVVGQIWREVKTYEPQVKQYTNEVTGQVIAEVLGSDDPNFDFEFIIEYPSQTDEKRRAFLRKKGT